MKPDIKRLRELWWGDRSTENPVPHDHTEALLETIERQSREIAELQNLIFNGGDNA